MVNGEEGPRLVYAALLAPNSVSGSKNAFLPSGVGAVGGTFHMVNLVPAFRAEGGGGRSE